MSASGETLVAMSTVDSSTSSPDGTTSSTGSSTGEPPGPFVFDETPFEDYVQVDRKGFPVVNTVFNLLGDKDAYNQGTPLNDAALTFVTNVFQSLETLHLGQPGDQTPDNTGLDDDLLTFGVEPCIPPPSVPDTCDDQSGPFAIPDVLTLDLDAEVGFPNGRRLEELVPDIMFAVLLIDLDTHDVSLWYDLDQDGRPGPSLDPIANDVEFPAEFPYLAPAHE